MVAGALIYVGLVIGSVILLLLGLVNISAGFERYRERAIIRDWPVSSLEGISLGKTAVIGTARPDGTCEWMPFGGREKALAYDLSVTDTNKIEAAHVDEEHREPFVLETRSGSLRVDPSDLSFDLDEQRQFERTIESHEDIPADLSRFAEEHDLPSQGLERDRKFSYEYIAPGDEIFVYGRAVPDEERNPVGEKSVLLVAHDEEGGFISNKDVDRLLQDRRRALRRNVVVGIPEAVAGLAAFLWLTGIAQLFLGA